MSDIENKIDQNDSVDQINKPDELNTQQYFPIKQTTQVDQDDSQLNVLDNGAQQELNDSKSSHISISPELSSDNESESDSVISEHNEEDNLEAPDDNEETVDDEGENNEEEEEQMAKELLKQETEKREEPCIKNFEKIELLHEANSLYKKNNANNKAEAFEKYEKASIFPKSNSSNIEFSGLDIFIENVKDLDIKDIEVENKSTDKKENKSTMEIICTALINLTNIHANGLERQTTTEEPEKVLHINTTTAEEYLKKAHELYDKYHGCIDVELLISEYENLADILENGKNSVQIDYDKTTKILEKIVTLCNESSKTEQQEEIQRKIAKIKEDLKKNLSALYSKLDEFNVASEADKKQKFKELWNYLVEIKFINENGKITTKLNYDYLKGIVIESSDESSKNGADIIKLVFTCLANANKFFETKIQKTNINNFYMKGAEFGNSECLEKVLELYEQDIENGTENHFLFGNKYLNQINQVNPKKFNENDKNKVKNIKIIASLEEIKCQLSDEQIQKEIEKNAKNYTSVYGFNIVNYTELNVKAKEYLENENYTGAIKCYEKIIEILKSNDNPDYTTLFDYYYELLYIYTHLVEDETKFEKYKNEILKNTDLLNSIKDMNDPDYLEKLGDIHKWIAKECRDDENYKEARKCQEEADGYYKLVIESYMSKIDSKDIDVDTNKKIGNIYYRMSGNENKKEAFKHLKIAADKEDTDAIVKVAGMYQNASGVGQDYTETIKYLTKAADKGSIEAIIRLADIYINGKSDVLRDGSKTPSNIDKDVNLAMEYYRKAAEQGSETAMVKLINLYDKNTNEIGNNNTDEINKLVQNVIDSGNIKAIDDLGDYFFNKAKQQNQEKEKEKEYYYKEAFLCYKLGEEGGINNNNIHLCNLGRMYKNGYGVEKDYNKAIEYYEKAADQGNTSAMIELGDIYSIGIGDVKRNIDEAIKWYEKASENNADNCQLFYNLSSLYRNKANTEKNKNKKKEYEDKAEGHLKQGNKIAESYGNLYQKNGHCKKAIEYFRKTGDNKDKIRIGDMYMFGSGDVEQNINMAITWYKSAAEQGDADAMVKLGNMYYDGIGVKQDINEAKKLYEKAKYKANFEKINLYWEEGNTSVINEIYETIKESKYYVDRFLLAYMIKYNIISVENNTSMTTLFKLAAENGYTKAMVEMGDMYYDGIGAEKNIGEAKKWYEKAANSDDPDATAMFKLGNMYYDGIGAEKNIGEAKKWYEKAANFGNTDAMVKLGNMCSDGIGGKKDIEQAEKWYEKAANLNNFDAIAKLTEKCSELNLENNKVKKYENILDERRDVFERNKIMDIVKSIIEMKKKYKLDLTKTENKLTNESIIKSISYFINKTNKTTGFCTNFIDILIKVSDYCSLFKDKQVVFELVCKFTQALNNIACETQKLNDLNSELLDKIVYLCEKLLKFKDDKTVGKVILYTLCNTYNNLINGKVLNKYKESKIELLINKVKNTYKDSIEEIIRTEIGNIFKIVYFFKKDTITGVIDILDGNVQNVDSYKNNKIFLIKFEYILNSLSTYLNNNIKHELLNKLILSLNDYKTLGQDIKNKIDKLTEKINEKIKGTKTSKSPVQPSKPVEQPTEITQPKPKPTDQPKKQEANPADKPNPTTQSETDETKASKSTVQPTEITQPKPNSPVQQPKSPEQSTKITQFEAGETRKDDDDQYLSEPSDLGKASSSELIDTLNNTQVNIQTDNKNDNDLSQTNSQQNNNLQKTIIDNNNNNNNDSNHNLVESNNNDNIPFKPNSDNLDNTSNDNNVKDNNMNQTLEHTKHKKRRRRKNKIDQQSNSPTSYLNESDLNGSLNGSNNSGINNNDDNNGIDNNNNNLDQTISLNDTNNKSQNSQKPKSKQQTNQINIQNDGSVHINVVKNPSSNGTTTLSLDFNPESDNNNTLTQSQKQKKKVKNKPTPLQQSSHQLPVQPSDEENLKFLMETQQQRIDSIRQILKEKKRQEVKNQLKQSSNINNLFNTISSINNSTSTTIKNTISNNNNNNNSNDNDNDNDNNNNNNDDNNNNNVDINKATQNYINDIFLNKKVDNHKKKQEEFNNIAINKLNGNKLSNNTSQLSVSNNSSNNQPNKTTDANYLAQCIKDKDIIDNARKFDIQNYANKVTDDEQAKEIIRNKNFKNALLNNDGNNANNEKKGNGNVKIKNRTITISFDPEGVMLKKLNMLNEKYGNNYKDIYNYLASDKIVIELDHPITHLERLDIFIKFKTDFVNTCIDLISGKKYNTKNVLAIDKNNDKNTLKLFSTNTKQIDQDFLINFKEATLLANEWRELNENIRIYNNRIENKSNEYNPIVKDVILQIMMYNTLCDNINNKQDINNSIFSKTIFPNGINTPNDRVYAKELTKSFLKRIYDKDPEIMKTINDNANNIELSPDTTNKIENLKQSILIPYMYRIHLDKLKNAKIDAIQLQDQRQKQDSGLKIPMDF